MSYSIYTTFNRSPCNNVVYIFQQCNNQAVEICHKIIKTRDVPIRFCSAPHPIRVIEYNEYLHILSPDPILVFS